MSWFYWLIILLCKVTKKWTLTTVLFSKLLYSSLCGNVCCVQALKIWWCENYCLTLHRDNVVATMSTRSTGG